MKKLFSRVSFLLATVFFMLAATAFSFAQEAKPSPQTSPQPQASPQSAAPPSQQQTQQAAANPFASIPPAKPEDVSSIDAIIKAVYDVISGDAGVKRDWNRFRSLFYPGARMIPTGKNPQTKKAGGRVITPEDYITQSAKFLEERGFHEREITRRVEEYGNIAHVFSTYDSKHKLSDEKPFMRGINSIQLLNDGTRWWVLTIAWSAETPDTPLPEKYLKNQ